jgi:hypothetical protein
LLHLFTTEETKVHDSFVTKEESMALTVLIALFVVAWVAASVLGTQAYFRGEQSKPIHARNWRSKSFEQLAQTFSGTETDYNERTLASSLDAFQSSKLPDA